MTDEALFEEPPRHHTVAELAFDQAIVRGDYAQMEHWLARGARVDGHMFDVGHSKEPIGYAINENDAELVQWLIGKGADINLRYKPEWTTPLCESILRGTPEITQMLLASKTFYAGWESGSAIQFALIENQEDLALELLERGLVCPGISGPPPTTMLDAIKAGSLRMVKRLEELGEPFTMTETTHDGRVLDAYYFAVDSGQTRMLNHLHARGVPLKQAEPQLIQKAMAEDNVKIILWLARHGDHVEAPYKAQDNMRPRKAVFHAAAAPNAKTLKILLHAGADISAQDGYPSFEDTIKNILAGFGDQPPAHYLECKTVYCTHIAKVEAKIEILRHESTLMPRLIRKDGSATSTSLQIASLNRLPELFQLRDWQRRGEATGAGFEQTAEEARALYAGLFASLPAHYKTRLDKIDLTWATAQQDSHVGRVSKLPNLISGRPR